MSNKKHRLLTFVMLTSAAIGITHCFNKFIAKTAELKNKLKFNNSSMYEWRFGNIFYRKKGSGEPILLIHDFSQYASSAEWDNIVDALASKYTVYAVDLLGCGRSDKPVITYTNFLYVQMITDFVKNVIGESTNIVTSGFSGSLAVTACNYDSTLFKKLILINPPEIGKLNQNPTKQSQIAKYILEIPILGTFIYNMISLRGNIDLMLTEKYMYNPFHVNSEMVDTYYESAHRGNGNGRYVLSSISGKYMNMNISHALKAINNSILIVGGKQQPNIDSTINSYKKINSSIESVILSKAKYLPHYESPEKILEQIQFFFTED